MGFYCLIILKDKHTEAHCRLPYVAKMIQIFSENYREITFWL